MKQNKIVQNVEKGLSIVWSVIRLMVLLGAGALGGLITWYLVTGPEMGTVLRAGATGLGVVVAMFVTVIAWKIMLHSGWNF